ncbi:MAG: site-specific integrase [Adlercreutzia sp.]|nr:site-specific integrase [Adlercreutzia sp.]
MNPMELTIREITEAWYLPEKRARKRPNTVEGYESSLRLYVLPEFGHLTVQELARDAIQDWVLAFEKPGAARKAFNCLRQVIRWAIRKWSMLVIDPTVGIELPRAAKYRPAVLVARDLSKRLKGFWGHSLEPTVILSASLGLRPGECYALEWADIDMRGGAVSVTKTLQQTRGQVRIYPTKTEKSERTAYLPRWALDRLREIWRELGRPRGRIIGDLSPAAVAGRIRRFGRRMALPDVTMQCLRHTWGTLAMAAGVAIETIASMMGHSSINTAYEHYLRPNKSIYMEAQRKVSAYLLSFG